MSLYEEGAHKGFDYLMDNQIDRSKAESPGADINTIDQMSRLFSRSQMAKAHVSPGHHYLGSAPASCNVCRLRAVLIQIRKD